VRRASRARLENVWAVGNATQSLVLHWDGGSWKRVAVPSPGTDNVLYAVAASSAQNLWAVGSARVGAYQNRLHSC